MMDSIYGFDTDDRDRATAALMVYAIYRSRNRARFKVTPTMWDQVERFTKAAAKRARSVPQFVERLKPRLACESLRPEAMAVGLRGTIPLIESSHGEMIQLGDDGDRREFLTRVLDRCDEKRVVGYLRDETSWVILLVRDRLERERPIEKRFETLLDTDVEVV